MAKPMIEFDEEELELLRDFMPRAEEVADIHPVLLRILNKLRPPEKPVIDIEAVDVTPPRSGSQEQATTSKRPAPRRTTRSKKR